MSGVQFGGGGLGNWGDEISVNGEDEEKLLLSFNLLNYCGICSGRTFHPEPWRNVSVIHWNIRVFHR